MLARYGVPEEEAYLKAIQTVRSLDPAFLYNSMTVLRESKDSISAAQYGFGELSKLGLEWITIITDMLNRTYSAVGASGELASGSVEESFHVLMGALQTGFSNRKMLDQSYEASVVSGNKVSVAPAMNALRVAAGRKITGADLQSIQAVLVALRKSQGDSFQDLVAAEIPFATLIGKGHTAADLQRASRDWDTTVESVTETLGKRRVAFTKLLRFLCEVLQADISDVPAVPM